MAIQKLSGTLRAQASADPFLFVIQDVPPAWLKTFPTEQLNVGNGLPHEVHEDATVDTTDMLATWLTSKQFGRRTLVVAPLVEPVLGIGLGRDALSAVAHIRSHIDDVDARVDLYLVLVAPPDSDNSEKWRDAILRVERNEHICRTFLWLPPADSTNWAEAIRGFIGRTFLALPFEDSATTLQTLDPLRNLLSEVLMQANGPEELIFSAEQVSDWETILISAKPGRETAERLIEVVEHFNE